MNSKIRVLHVDDNLHDRQLVKDALGNGNLEFVISEANNRENFEKLIREERFDVVLSDFNILGFDGLQVIRYVKEIDPELPVIIVTGTGSEEIAIQAMKMGAADYVIKTVRHIQGLEPTIKAVIKYRKAQCEKNIAKEALQESEQRFQLLAENSPVGIFQTDTAGSLIYVNPRWCEISGLSKDEINGNAWMNSVHIEDRDTLRTNWEKAISEGSTLMNEYRFVRNDGSIAWVIGILLAQKNSREELVCFIGTITDITDRKHIEEALIEREEFLSSIIENIPDMIFIKEASEFRFTRVNKAAEELLGYKRDELLGKNDFDFFPGQAESFTTKDREVIESGRLSDVPEEPIDTKIGRRILHTKKIPVLNKSGKPAFLLGISEDITERKKSEERLLKALEKAEESDRLKTAFLHNISHEIRTPMNAIVGFSELLKTTPLQNEKYSQYIEIIVQSSDQLLSIINDLISIATIETGQTIIRENTVNLNSLMNLLYMQFCRRAEKQNLSISYQVPNSDHESNILTDVAKLSEVISNLIGNAIKFTKKGNVSFGYEQRGGYLEFSVKDTGIGIPVELHEDIFKRFRQAEMSTSRQFGGSGLGLSISKAYVELLGGKIWLNSSPGEGSCFYFTIPFKPAQKNQQTVAEQTETTVQETEQQKTLLIAEDEDYNFMLIEELLSGLNYKIIRAVDGEGAVEICRSNPDIDLILMDIKMPFMNGYDATKIIKEIRPGLPVIAQTAYSNEADKKKAYISGCCDFLSKPFTRDTLVSKIKKQLMN